MYMSWRGTRERTPQTVWRQTFPDDVRTSERELSGHRDWRICQPRRPKQPREVGLTSNEIGKPSYTNDVRETRCYTEAH